MRDTAPQRRSTGIAAMGAILLTGTILAGGYSYLIVEPLIMTLAVQIEHEAGHAILTLSEVE